MRFPRPRSPFPFLGAMALLLWPPNAAPAQDARGIYVYSLNVAIDKDPGDAPQMVSALGQRGTDGITLVEGWKDIEPRRGVFQWDPPVPPGQSRFDRWVQTAISSGKKINLAIRAGVDTPTWLFQPVALGGAGATPLTFQSSPHQGLSRPNCDTVTIAAPWDPVFLAEWDSMLAAVAAHLHAIGGWDAVSMIRLTGVNRTTDEFRLPEEILTNPPAPCDTNSIQTWLEASPPYRPARLIDAWDRITTSFQTSFPGKTFNVPIIPIDTGQGQFPFPEIGDDGCVLSPPVPIPPPTGVINACVDTGTADHQDARLNAVLTNLLALASEKFPGRLIVEFENLDFGKPASSTVIDASQNLGTMMGFMTNNYFAAKGQAGAACSGGFVDPHRCVPSDYLALLNTGIYPLVPPLDRSDSPRSQFIEVLDPDVLPPQCTPANLLSCGYPDQIWRAHVELVDYTPPVITASADPATLWPPRGQMVLVTVSGTMTDDLSGVNRDSALFSVEDEYGAITPGGSITVAENGAYSFTVLLEARRDGSDTDGRLYTIHLSVQDQAGNTGLASMTVVVPHDEGK